MFNAPFPTSNKCKCSRILYYTSLPVRDKDNATMKAQMKEQTPGKLLFYNYEP